MYIVPKDLYETVRNLIWSIGGVGAAIGLWFANQRQKTFSAQVQGEVDQSFNERLGRGVELLANEDVVMRSAGVSALVDLANNATDVQKPIVVNIIYDFFHSNASIKYDKNGEPLYVDEKERGKICKMR